MALWLNEQADAVGKPEDAAPSLLQALRRGPSAPPGPAPSRRRPGRNGATGDRARASRGARCRRCSSTCGGRRTRAELEPVPADMVMTSGSGLDPDITLKSGAVPARPRGREVGRADGRDGPRSAGRSRDAQRGAEAPLGGLAGVKLVNVLEINAGARGATRRRKRRPRRNTADANPPRSILVSLSATHLGRGFFPYSPSNHRAVAQHVPRGMTTMPSRMT